MKRSGILNPAIAHLLASTGHTDYFTICDAGFPVPLEPARIDLAVVSGLPTGIAGPIPGGRPPWAFPAGWRPG